MTETSFSSSPPPKDRFWWLPFPIALATPFLCMLPSVLFDWLFPPPPNMNSGYISQPFCWMVLFLSSTPGRLVICTLVFSPAIVLLSRRTKIGRDGTSYPLIAYLFTAAAGLLGTVRLVPYRLYSPIRS